MSAVKNTEDGGIQLHSVGDFVAGRGLIADRGPGVSALRRGLLSRELEGGIKASCFKKQKGTFKHSRQKEQNVREAEVGKSLTV